MVKKLLKHEFIYYVRTLAIFVPLLLVISGVTRLTFYLSSLENSGFAVNLAFLLSMIMIILGSVGLALYSWALSIIRFYKNMYTAEGYLTLTLPVTSKQHVLVKLTAAVVCSLVCGIVIIAALMIAFGNKLFIQSLQQMWISVKEALAVIPMVHRIFYIVEFAFVCFTSLLSPYLLIYACITIGQTAKKNRILKAFGAYFVFYLLSQVISFVITVFSVFVGASIAAFAYLHPYAMLHVSLITVLMFNLILLGLYFYITIYIINKKLNLE